MIKTNKIYYCFLVILSYYVKIILFTINVYYIYYLLIVFSVAILFEILKFMLSFVKLSLAYKVFLKDSDYFTIYT